MSDYLIYTYQISGMQYKEERDSINIIISKNLMNKIHGIIDIILWNNYIPESENELRAISERL